MLHRRSAPASTTSANVQSSPSMIENRRRSQEESSEGLLSFLRFWRQGPRERDDGAGEDEDQLLAGIHALRATGKLTAKTADFRRKAANAFSKWAKGANNNAMADIVGRTSELLGMSADREFKFAEEYDQSLKQLQKRLDEAMKRGKKEKKEWDKWAALESSLRKSGRGSDSHEHRVKLAEARLEREEAERKLAHERMEAEVCRIYHIQEGLKKIADAQLNLAKQLEMISACQQELVEFVPKISKQDICQMNYSSRAKTRQRVAQLRDSLESAHQDQMPTNPPTNGQNRQPNFRRQSHPPPLPIAFNNSGTGNIQQNGHHRRRIRDRVPPPPLPSFAQLVFPMTPPPAYTPTAPPIELADSDAGTPRATTRNNPNRHSIGADTFFVNHSPTTSSGRPANQLYPKLDKNPFKESLEIKQRIQREAQERTLTGWLGGRQ